MLALTRPPARSGLRDGIHIFGVNCMWKIVLGIIGLTVAVIVSSATLFFSGPQAVRTGPSLVLLQHYLYVTITNKTPFAVGQKKTF